MSQKQNPPQSFEKLGLLQKAKLLERAKELGDKKTLIKEALKQKQLQQSDQQNGIFNSTFAKKLDNDQYLCTCCSVKLLNTIQAAKHFNSTEHKQSVENFKVKIQKDINERKDQRAQEQEQSKLYQQELKTKFMLVQEEEIIDEDSEDIDNNQSNQYTESVVGEVQNNKHESLNEQRELDLLDQLDKATQEQKQHTSNQIQKQVLEIEEEVKQNLSKESEDEDQVQEAGYEKRLISDISEMETLQMRIDEKKKQLVSKKRQNKVDLKKLLEEDDDGENVDIGIMFKKRRF
eukprot:403364161